MLKRFIDKSLSDIDGISHIYYRTSELGISGIAAYMRDSVLLQIYVYSSGIICEKKEFVKDIDVALDIYNSTLNAGRVLLQNIKLCRDLAVSELVGCTSSADYLDLLWCMDASNMKMIPVRFGDKVPDFMDISNLRKGKFFFKM